MRRTNVSTLGYRRVAYMLGLISQDPTSDVLADIWKYLTGPGFYLGNVSGTCQTNIAGQLGPLIVSRLY